MGRHARAALIGDSTKRTCDMHVYSTHHCCPHTSRGKLTNGSSNVIIEGTGAVRLGDGEKCNCPHNGSGVVTEGSGSVFINGRAAIRVKDEVTCYFCGQTGSVIDGARSVFIGN